MTRRAARRRGRCATSRNRRRRRKAGKARRKPPKPGKHVRAATKTRRPGASREEVSAPAEVIVHRDAGLLAKAVAARIITRLVDAQASKGSASLVLTGGGIGGASLRAVRESPAVEAVDWRPVDIWWGDERFVARDGDERNEKQAREALLDHVDVDPARVFPMGWLGGEDGNDADAAAARYAETLASRTRHEDHGPVPQFDVLLLGSVPEGHVASIFPESPAAHEERTSPPCTVARSRLRRGSA